MGRPVGGKNKEWTSREKYEVIKPIIKGEMSSLDRIRELGIAHSMVKKWVSAYNKGGIKALENKRKPGNPLAKYSRRKELSYTE